MITRDAEVYFLDGCGRCKLGGTPECKIHKWENELKLFRQLVLDTGLTEECKWGMPCYTLNGKVILLISAFKDYCCLNFFKGSLIQDTFGILSRAGENSEAARMYKTTDSASIVTHADQIRSYILEAIEIEKSGQKPAVKPVSAMVIPEEFQRALDQNLALAQAFNALTPGRQKAYIFHFSGAKQSATRESRVQKCIPAILAGKGFNE